VNFEHDHWFDVPAEENRHIECSFCIPSNEICIVQVTNLLLQPCHVSSVFTCPLYIMECFSHSSLILFFLVLYSYLY